MKNLHTFEEFLNESNRTKRADNKINFLKDSTSDIDHTRLVKWLGKNIDSNKYYFEKSKTVGYWILDVKKLSERELKDLLQYLESNKYKFGTQIWLPAYESEINEGLKAAIDINIEDAKSIFRQLKEGADKINIGLGSPNVKKDLLKMIEYKSCTLQYVETLLGSDNEILFGLTIVDSKEKDDFAKDYHGQGPYIKAKWENGELTNLTLVEAWKWGRSQMNKQKTSWWNTTKEILK